MPTAAATSGRVANDLVLAATSAVLKTVLENGLVDRGVANNVGADALVSALPPDRVDTGDEERAQLNLFLYQVRPKGMAYGRNGAPGRAERWGSQSPAYELNYLVSAYGAEDLQTELLLGFVIQLFDERPVLDSELIASSLAAAGQGRPMVPGLATIRETGLARRLREVRISHQALTADEMFNLWSTLQTIYRPSVVYKVSVFVEPLEGDS